MDEKEIIQNLIRALMFYGITKGWELQKLTEEYMRLGIPEELVNETLNEDE
ncbi:hypothetical protein [Coprococcus sp. AF19-8AC]|uniref:hypothetical protein n=1 Tax=Coprococcus sp. AF19-8AC TaxID=2293090 RepID=UPI001403BC67|nr:hypothetical protein [Coprococcus sp. AF19-8AC]